MTAGVVATTAEQVRWAREAGIADIREPGRQATVELRADLVEPLRTQGLKVHVLDRFVRIQTSPRETQTGPWPAGATRKLAPRACDQYAYNLYNTNVGIPDDPDVCDAGEAGYARTSVAISEPAGHAVCNVKYRVRIVHSSVGDLLVELNAAQHPMGSRYTLWDRLGGADDGGYDDDPDDDDDIYLNWRDTDFFNGIMVDGTWQLDVWDECPGATGLIDYAEYRIYFNVAPPTIEVEPTSLIVSCAPGSGAPDGRAGEGSDVRRALLTLLAAPDSAGLGGLVSTIEALGGRILTTLDRRIVWCTLPPAAPLESLEVAGVMVARDAAEAEALAASHDPLVASAAKAFARSVGQGREDDPTHDPTDALVNDQWPQPPLHWEHYLSNLRGAGVEPSDPLVAARLVRQGPRGVGPGNSDDMTGTVAVAILFIESDGSIDPDTYTWTLAHENDILADISSGLAWWATQAVANGRSVTFDVLPYRHSDARMQQGYEPILHPSFHTQFWVSTVLANLGYDVGTHIDRVTAFNTWLRIDLGTDWAYTAVICYNPPPAPNRYTDGYSAFAYGGGPYTSLLYRSFGWSFDRVFTHETGHIFRACDEYYQAGYGGCMSCGHCSHGVDNGNCEYCNPAPVACMMRSNSWSLCSYTPGHLGWQPCFGIRNDGSETLTVTTVDAPLWITLVPAPPYDIAPDASVSICVQTDCSACDGNQDDTMWINHNDPNAPPVEVSVRLICPIAGGEPDLIIQSSSRSPASGVDPGDTINLTDVVRNQGTDATDSHFWATWYISTDSNVTDDDHIWVWRRIDSGLGAGATSSGASSPVWPDVAPYNTLGATYYVAVMADDTNEVPDESDEENNWGQTWAVTLGVVFEGACCLADGGACTPGVCGHLEPCGEGATCFCALVAEGGGHCMDGDAPCDSTPCPNGSSDCPVGELCYVNTCCGGPVCAPDCSGGRAGESDPRNDEAQREHPGVLPRDAEHVTGTGARESCIETTEADCVARGGAYEGDGTDCGEPDGCAGDCEYTISGAIHTDCDAPFASGLAGVTVTVAGDGGTFAATTSGEQGFWLIPDIPCGEYSVTPDMPLWRFCHVADACPPDPCAASAAITVDAAHQAENLAIPFFAQEGCLLSDMNYDGFVSIIGDVPLFVDCVYFDDCSCPQDGCVCPGDCNCDGFLSIIGDVPCFVDCTFFGTCQDCPARGDSPAQGNGFTIGGAAYWDKAKPLLTGIEGIIVNILDGQRRTIASTRTAGSFGLWRIDNLPEGRYTVVLIGGGGKVPGWRHVIKITVNAENEAANQSIQLLRTHHGSKRTAR